MISFLNVKTNTIQLDNLVIDFVDQYLREQFRGSMELLFRLTGTATTTKENSTTSLTILIR